MERPKEKCIYCKEEIDHYAYPACNDCIVERYPDYLWPDEKEGIKEPQS